MACVTVPLWPFLRRKYQQPDDCSAGWSVALLEKELRSNEHVQSQVQYQVQSQVCLGGGSNLQPHHDGKRGGPTRRQSRPHRKGFGQRSASGLGLPWWRLARGRLAPRVGKWRTGGLARSRMARRMGLASSCRLGMARWMGLASSCRLGLARWMGLASAALRFRRCALGLARRWMARGRMARRWMARRVARRLGTAPLVARQSDNVSARATSCLLRAASGPAGKTGLAPGDGLLRTVCRPSQKFNRFATELQTVT